MEAAAPDDAQASENAADAEPDASLSEMIDRAITLLEDVAGIVESNMNDCDVMADRVEAYRNEHLDSIKQTVAIYRSRNREEFEKLKVVFHDRYRAAWARIRPGILKCRKKPKMHRVLMEIWGDDPDAGI